MSEIKDLIIVPGHAAFKSGFDPSVGDPGDEANWVLQSFQAGESPFYIEHVRAGIEALAKHVGALLLFSGGRTRQESDEWSEAATYAAVAKFYNYWQSTNDAADEIKKRIILEEHARDSLENVQFGIESFKQLTKKNPEHVTVVGWEFKAPRFDFHRQTLGINQSNFSYLSVNNPPDLAGAQKGEAKTLELFKNDPYGQKPPLADKKLKRNPFNVPIPYSF